MKKLKKRGGGKYFLTTTGSVPQAIIPLRPCVGGRLPLVFFLPESSACLTFFPRGAPCEDDRVNPDPRKAFGACGKLPPGAPAGKIWTQLENHLAFKKLNKHRGLIQSKNRLWRSNGSVIEFGGSNSNQSIVLMPKHNGGVLTNQTADPHENESWTKTVWKLYS